MRDSAPQWRPLTSLPDELSCEGVRPLTARRHKGGQRLAVWQAKLSIEAKRLAVLRHLASHCDAPGVRHLHYSRRHLVFLAGDRRPERCIAMLRGRGIHHRSAVGGGRGYVSIVLGRRRSGDVRSGRMYISIDAHRLVCWLVHGPPAERGCTEVNALHSCGHEWCVNPAHLEWGTQASNVRHAHNRRAAKRIAMLGASQWLLSPHQSCPVSRI